MASKCLPDGAIWRAFAAALVTGVLSVPVHAQPPEKAAPKATLDVCENAATGKWIYSGVVSLGGDLARGASAKVDYLVQNRVHGPGFRDTYRAAALPVAQRGGQVFGFSLEAPALTLGTVRGTAKVQLADPANPGRFSTFEVVAPQAVCGCQPVKGCVRTQGYWGNKPGVVWPAPYSRDALFFSSALALQQILDAPVRGSGYLILAKQYIAAVLNYAAGASAPPSIIAAIDEAQAFFASGTTPDSCGSGQCEAQKTLAGILDTYNNGEYPGAPRQCAD